MKNKCLEWLWAWRIKRLWKRENTVGQFLSEVGYYQARGWLPQDILERFPEYAPDKDNI